MKQRCTNPKASSFARYGGSGVVYSVRWAKFKNFLEDMGVRPDRTTLDRWPNSRGNYEPGNCRWATASEQANNRKSNVFLTVDGRSQTIAQWANELGISQMTVARRMKANLPLLHPVRARTPRSEQNRGSERICVRPHKNRFRAYRHVFIDGVRKQIHLGMFASPQEAYAAFRSSNQE